MKIITRRKKIEAIAITAIFAISVFAVLASMAGTVEAGVSGGGQILNVAEWSGITTLANVSGRSAVIKTGDTYRMWYSSHDETTLNHTSSTDPDSFGTGTECTFIGGTPAEVGSVSVCYEGNVFYMIAYGTNNQKFAIYNSTDGTNWTYAGTVFGGKGLPDYNKIDGPYLFEDSGTYRLYFQVKTPKKAQRATTSTPPRRLAHWQI